MRTRGTVATAGRDAALRTVAAVHDMARPYRPTALPSVAARVLAFVAIVIGGLCGGLIGYAFTDLQCGPEHPAKAAAHATNDDSGCDGWNGLGGVVGPPPRAPVVRLHALHRRRWG